MTQSLIFPYLVGLFFDHEEKSKKYSYDKTIPFFKFFIAITKNKNKIVIRKVIFIYFTIHIDFSNKSLSGLPFIR